jgi:thiol-disulfide isomerase/thioredoxin
MVILGGPVGGAAAGRADPLEALVVQSYLEPPPAPAVTLSDLDGRARALADFRGQVVFLNFWATWCVPCRQEMPALEMLYRTYRDRGFVVLGVNFREATREVRAFMDDARLTFPALLDTDAKVSEAFRVRGLPVSFLLDRQGRILWKAVGTRPWDGPHGRAHLAEVLGPPPR